jgi:hypothetical protein
VETGEDGGQQGGAEARRCADCDMPATKTLDLGDGMDDFGEVPEDAPGKGEELLSGIRQRRRSAATVEEGRSERLLEPANLGTDRWLRHVQAVSSSGELLFFGDCHEVLELVDRRVPRVGHS